MIKRDIIFTYNKDLYMECPPFFKIYRCPEEFPHPPMLFGHHPFFIEYEVGKVKNNKGLASGVRQIKKDNKYSEFKEKEISGSLLQSEHNSRVKNEFLTLVNSLTDNYLFTYGSQVKQGWSIALDKEDKLSYSQDGYISPDFVTEIDEISFTGTHKIHDLLLQVSDDKGNIIRSIGVTDLIEIYHSIKDISLKKSFYNACIVFNKAQYLSAYEYSASYIFMVSALEALIEIENQAIKVESCSTCGQPKYKVNRKFKDFIDKYGFNVSNKIKSDFYNLRSKISHAGQLLEGSYDLKFHIQGQEDLDSEYIISEQRQTYENFKTLTRVCFSKFLFGLESGSGS